MVRVVKAGGTFLVGVWRFRGGVKKINVGAKKRVNSR